MCVDNIEIISGIGQFFFAKIRYMLMFTVLELQNV